MYKFIVCIYLNRVPFPPSLKFSGFKNSMKLGGWQEKFKVTLLERPSKKSCSTSIYFGNPSFLKMSRVWGWLICKSTLVRGSHEHPIEQTKQTVRAKSSCQRQQSNVNESKARKHDMHKQSQANNFA